MTYRDITVRAFPVELWQRVKRTAKKRGMTVPQMLEHIIRVWFDEGL